MESFVPPRAQRTPQQIELAKMKRCIHCGAKHPRVDGQCNACWKSQGHHDTGSGRHKFFREATPRPVDKF